MSTIFIDTLFIAFGILSVATAKKTTLFCSRLNLYLECSLTIAGLTGSEIISVNGLKGARIQTLETTKTKKNDRGEKIEETTTTYQILLVTEEGERPFTDESDSLYYPKQKLVGNITYFLENQA